MLDVTDLARELRWASAYLGTYGEALSAFLQEASSFQRALLMDDFPRANDALARIEHQFGQSIWLIKRRIPFLQLSTGLDAQKQYVTTIRAATQDTGVAPFLAYFISIRSEPSVTPSRFRAQYERDSSVRRLPADLGDYLAFHIVPGIRTHPAELASLLRFEEASSVIDYFEMFVYVTRLASAVEDPEVSEQVKTALLSLRRRVTDPRLGTLSALLGFDGHAAVPASDLSIQAADAVVTGAYGDAIALAAAALRLSPADPTSLFGLAWAQAMVSDNPPETKPLANALCTRLTRLLRQDPAASDELAELTRYAVNFDGDAWADSLFAAVELATSPKLEPTAYEFSHLSALNMPALHPFAVELLPRGPERVRQAELLARFFPAAPSTDYAIALASGDAAAIPQIRHSVAEFPQLLLARHAIATGMYDVALNASQVLQTSAVAFFRSRGVAIECWSLLGLKRTREGIIRTANAVVRDQVWHESVPIADAASAARLVSREELADTLALPVLLDLEVRYTGAEHERERVFALLDLLDAYNLRYPSELVSDTLKFEHALLVYLLRFVCVEGVLDRSGRFDSSTGVIEERLEICRLLTELDPDNTELYHTEIKAILRRLMIKRRMKEVEQSRVYVDVDSIKRTVEGDLREAYNRYILLRRVKADPTGPEEVRSALRRASEGDVQELKSLTLPKDEAGQLFEAILWRLRDEFLISPEHGLEKYLSVRIRHGTLSAHLRKPLEAANIITQRAAGSGTYRRNQYWLKSLGIEGTGDGDQLADRLAKFSSDFDRLVEEIKSWIRVAKTVTSSGMFSYPLTEPQVRLLAEFVAENNNYDQSVEYLIEQFGVLLDTDLERVRTRILDEGKSAAAAMMTQLGTDVDRLGFANAGSLIHAIRTALSELRLAFDRIAMWFVRAKSIANEPFTLDEALDLSVEAVKTVAREFRAEISVEVDSELRLEGQLFPVLVDMFFIVFENIVRHSGTVDRPLARGTVCYKDGAVHVRIENDIAEGIANESSRGRVDAIRDALRDEREHSAVSREGGTGFHKLSRILSHDLGVDSGLEFRFLDDRHFLVAFSMPVTIRSVEI